MPRTKKPNVVPKSKARQNKRISVPSAIGNLVKTSTPDLQSSFTGDGRVRIRHREYIADVAGSVTFASTAFAVNPGIAATFPCCQLLLLIMRAISSINYAFNLVRKNRLPLVDLS